MTLQRPDPAFFVGYFKKVPATVRRVALMFGVFFLAGLVSASLALSLSGQNPGSGGYVDELGGRALSGIIETRPYAVLRVPAGHGRPARAVMLSGQGKSGVTDAALPLQGRWAQARGVFVKRGDLDMLLVGGGDGLSAAAPPADMAQPSPPVSLGRWQLTGEICDGKCYGGAMKPGTGLAHKACANLCITGDVPPVFVTTSPVDGRGFLLMAGPDGGPLPKALLDRTAERIVLEGEVERRDDLLVFRVDVPQRTGAGS
jgi:hypothetical protein